VRPPASDPQPVRIQLVASGTYPPDFGGGQLRVHRTLLRMRNRFPMHVDILAFAGELTRAGSSQVDGIPVVRLPESLRTLPLVWAIGRQMLRARRQGIEVVYIISTGRLAYVAGLMARWCRLPLIVEIVSCNLHDTKARQLAAGMHTRGANLAVAISQPVARELRAFGVEERRVWVRPNPVDIERYRLPSSEERRQERGARGYATEEVVHLVAGALAPRKNQIFAIEAIERLDRAHHLLLVGPVWAEEPDYADRLRERIATSPARHRIRLDDSFTDELHRVMYAADCLWMPSLEEGLGNVMLEALCCGVPCVINRALGMDEHVQDGVNGRQAPLDPATWAEAVESVMALVRASDRRRAISVEAQQRYDAARFDAEFYERILAVAAAKR
jgi:glycosyltransferase involved in cell wall biosynthesis